jgi:prephenate dehydratase
MSRPTSASSSVAYLGPEGTFTHMVAQKRCGEETTLISCADIRGVFEGVMAQTAGSGIVPLVNSSGGWIDDTIELLIHHAPNIHIEELLSLDVKLALVGHAGQPIKAIYSHFAPLKDKSAWLDLHYPAAKRVRCVSTAQAAKMARENPEGAALTSRNAAKIYGLDVLEFPLEQAEENVTSFVKIAYGKAGAQPGERLGLILTLRDEPGSLVSFLLPFSEAGINLTKILSRPMQGKPGECHFFVEIDAREDHAIFQKTLARAERHTAGMASLGNYIVQPRYQS